MAILDKFKQAFRNLLGEVKQEAEGPSPSQRQALMLIEQGNILEDQGLLIEARSIYEKAIQVDPASARAHLNLGNVDLALGRANEAIKAYEDALARQSNFAAAHFNIGNAHLACNRPIDALKSYDQALMINPKFVDALVAKGNVQGDLKDYDSAIVSYIEALKIRPDYVEVLLNLGNTYRALARLDDAVKCFAEVLSLNAESPELFRSFGLAYKALDRLEDAIVSFEKAVELKKDYVDAQIDLANAYREIGEIDRAVKISRLARDLDPNNSGAWSLYLFCLSDCEGVDRDVLFSEHRRFGEHFEKQISKRSHGYKNLRDPEKILRLGIVSGDLRNHAVASFFEPVLYLLLKMPGLSIYIYETSGLEDEVTRRIKAKVKYWRDVEIISSEALDDLIRKDLVDILIDLSGHTPANRLLTFARKPAPIQMSWIGYPGTTGLKAIDYYIGDRHFLPHGEYDSLFSEKILRLPANAPFFPSPFAPDVNELPGLVNGYVTFASFNRIDKIGRSVVRVWSSLLRLVPNSRMILAGMPIGGGFEHLIKWFAEEGVESDRIDFYRRSSMAEYLKMHSRVDICLDTFPYGGGTTTCHALWMGVPTLTLVGSTPTSGVGRAILSHVGLHAEFCAYDQDDFIGKGLFFAHNLSSLKKIRSELRMNMQKSALLQPELIAGSLEYALRHSWREWCVDSPAITYEVGHQIEGYYIVDPPSSTPNAASC